MRLHLHAPAQRPPFRGLVLGLLLIPPNSYFIMSNHLIYWSTLPTTFALMFNVVITLTAVTALNMALRRYWPRFALTPGELLVVYVMLAIASALAGHDMLQTVIPTVPNGFWYASAENEWKELFHSYLPRWLTSDDVDSLAHFYDGRARFATWEHFHDWARPALWWTVLMSLLALAMISLNGMLAGQWIYRERLTFPIVRLPMALVSSERPLLRNRAMWAGFAIAAVIDLTNGLHVFYPAAPGIPVRKVDLGVYFTAPPWNALGWTPLYVLPFGLGLAFLMPLDVSFSLWFCYIVWKLERVLGRVVGVYGMPGFPYAGPQGAGAYMALAVLALVAARRHVSGNVRRLLRGVAQGGVGWPALGVCVSGGLLLAFGARVGMGVLPALLYFAVYFWLSLAITRVRAEVGPPTHEMFVATPHHVIDDVFGTRRFSPGSLTGFAMFAAFNRGSRANPMPHAMEGFKLARDSSVGRGWMSVAILLATVAGTLWAFCAYLHVSYTVGANPGLGSVSYDLLRRWLYHPSTTDVPASAFMLVGFGITTGLWLLRGAFPGWPLHPAGYAVASSQWTFGWLWFSVFISWAVKFALLRFGGMRYYRKAAPLFMGLLLGEYIVGGGWVLIRLAFGVRAYSFYR
ncbi:hypothetical protein HOI71_29185 [Candidatus Poribacteria bacterium]|nr:hypothetical protein [Candidatus Poribacteria bacterium]